jgi:hypothetical protein
VCDRVFVLYLCHTSQAAEQKKQIISDLVNFICTDGERKILSNIGIIAESSIGTDSIFSKEDYLPGKSSTTFVTAGQRSRVQQKLSVSQQRSTTGGGMSFSERSVVRQHCRRLLSLLRLADFMLRDAMFECVENNLVALKTQLTKVQTKNDSQKGEISTEKVTKTLLKVDFFK